MHLIKSHDCLAGVVINPATPVDTLSEVLDIVDYVLVMSVNPGFGAQTFIPNSVRKITQLDEIRAERRLNYRIEVDGGIAVDTIPDVVRAGAEILVAGNAVFGHGDPRSKAQTPEGCKRSYLAESVISRRDEHPSCLCNHNPPRSLCLVVFRY